MGSMMGSYQEVKSHSSGTDGNKTTELHGRFLEKPTGSQSMAKESDPRVPSFFPQRMKVLLVLRVFRYLIR